MSNPRNGVSACLTALTLLALNGCATTRPITSSHTANPAGTEAIARPLSRSDLERLRLSKHAVKFSKDTYGRRIEGRNEMAVQQTLLLPNLTFEQLLAAEKCGIINDKSTLFIVDRRAVFPGDARAVVSALRDAEKVEWYYTFWCQDRGKVSILPADTSGGAACPTPTP